MGSAHLRVLGISGTVGKRARQAICMCMELREEVGRRYHQMQKQGIYWLLLEVKLFPTKGDPF